MFSKQSTTSLPQPHTSNGTRANGARANGARANGARDTTCRYHSVLTRRRRDALALLSPAQQLLVCVRCCCCSRVTVLSRLTHHPQNRSADAVFKTALKRDAHPPAHAADAPAGNSSLLSTQLQTATDCVGCSSFMLPVMMRTSMSEKVSATVCAQDMPRQGAFNRAVA